MITTVAVESHRLDGASDVPWPVHRGSQLFAGMSVNLGVCGRVSVLSQDCQCSRLVWRRYGHGDPGVPVRAGPHPRAGGGVAVALRCAALRLQLGPGGGDGEPGPAGGRALLRHRRGGADPAADWSAFSLRKIWNQAKDQVAPWWAENCKEAYASGLANLATALGELDRLPYRHTRARRSGSHGSRAGGRGCRAGSPPARSVWPRPTGGMCGCPGSGWCARTSPPASWPGTSSAGTARIRSATVTCRAGRWFVSFSVEITRTDPAPARPDAVVGVDLGVTHLAVLSTPSRVSLTSADGRQPTPSGPRPAGTAPVAAPGRPPPGTGQAHRAEAVPTLAQDPGPHRRPARRVANARRDGLHKLTTRLVGTCRHDRDRRPQRGRHAPATAAWPAISPASGWAELRRQLDLQDHLARRCGWRRRPLVPLQDLLGLWRGESQIAPADPGVHLRRVRPRAGS